MTYTACRASLIELAMCKEALHPYQNQMVFLHEVTETLK